MGQAQGGGDVARSDEGMRSARVPACTHVREAVNVPRTNGRGRDRARFSIRQGRPKGRQIRVTAGGERRQDGLGEGEASEGGGVRKDLGRGEGLGA